MNDTTLIRNAQIINEGRIFHGDLRIEGDRIAEIAVSLSGGSSAQEIDAKGRLLLPGLIDDQVHFREPGSPEKGDMESESRAAVLGGITTVFEMPNTTPPTTTRQAIEDKFSRARGRMHTNYSFYLGATDDNLDQIRAAHDYGVCGVKIFMGASTGSLLVDDPEKLLRIFETSPLLIATHCEDSRRIAARRQLWDELQKGPPQANAHPFIRDEEACFNSSRLAVELARATGAKLHVLHISTARELELFSDAPLEEKRITAEVCVHHLCFDERDYERLGHRLKWNPSVKSKEDRIALVRALERGKLDLIATDHAPHTLEEKLRPYDRAPSGGPLVEHALPALLRLCSRGSLSIQTLVERMCHAPARLFGVTDRGYLREGYFADLCLVDLHAPWIVEDAQVASRVGWSPFTGERFEAKVTDVWVNGDRVVRDSHISAKAAGRPVTFARAHSDLPSGSLFPGDLRAI